MLEDDKKSEGADPALYLCPELDTPGNRAQLKAVVDGLRAVEAEERLQTEANTFDLEALGSLEDDRDKQA
jgi:hypothetical protein